MEQHKKILVYLFGSLGDSIVAIPALRAVRRNFPGAEIVLLQNFQTVGAVLKASDVIPDGLVDRYLSYNSELGLAAKVLGFYQLWRQLRRERFDAAVYLVISERPAKAVFRDRYFFRACGIRKLFGFHAFSPAELYPIDADGRPAMTEHESIRKLRRLARDGIESLPEDYRMPMMQLAAPDLDRIDKWLASNRRDPGGRLIAIAPGCKTQANVWPLENFAQLGARLIAKENCEIVVVGGKTEFEIGEQLIAEWGNGINSAGAFTIPESAALLSKCDLYIGLDTGSTHLAAVVGTRCFALYGERNNQGQWFPMGDGHTVLFHPVKCAGCRLLVCPVPGHPCMTGISLESAWAGLKDFMARDTVHERSGVEVIAA